MTAPASSTTVKSALRTLDIIELVVAHPQGVVAQDLAAALVIPVSSLSYLLSTLTERGYLLRAGRRYLPGPGLSRLRASPADLSLADRVTPLVRALRNEVNETASFMVRQGFEAEALVTEASEQALRYAIDPGTRRPLHALAAGKAILAALNEAELAAYFASSDRAALTPATRTSEPDLRADLAQARSTGLALSRDEATPGICGFAVVALINGTTAGAFSVAVPAARIDAGTQARVAAALARAAAALNG
jgi:IclR family transcriptional regulator, acetate operon repressor